MRRRVLSSLIACAAMALTATGCGVAENAPQPGVAASIDDTKLELADLDTVVTDFCDFLADQGTGVYPRAQVRAAYARNWAFATAVDALAKDLDVQIGPKDADRAIVEAFFGDPSAVTDENFASMAFVQWTSDRAENAVLQVGAALLQQEGQEIDQEAAASRGFEAVTAWMAERDLELNPVLGDVDTDSGALVADRLTVPVSTQARGADNIASLSDEAVAALPVGQRCGTAAAMPELVPGA